MGSGLRTVLGMGAALALAACSGNDAKIVGRGQGGPGTSPTTPGAATPPAQPPTSAPPGPRGTPPPPPTPSPAGEVSFRIANFLPTPADVCVKGDDGIWQGPLFARAANKAVPPAAVTERTKIGNSHFVGRIVGADCTAALSADVALPVLGATWSATLVLGTSGGTSKLAFLVDDPTASATYTYVRLVHTAAWSTSADLGFIDDNGDFAGICVDASFLATAKSGTLDAQGYGFVTPLDGNTSLVVRASPAQTTVLQIDGLTTDTNQIYTLYTMGTVAAPTVLFCDDEAPATDHVAPCRTLPAAPGP